MFDSVIVVIGGGLNVMGLFYEFLDDFLVCIIGVEVGGCGVDDWMEYCVSLIGGCFGVLYGNCIYLL